MPNLIQDLPDRRVRAQNDPLIKELLEVLGPHPYRIHRQLLGRGIAISLATVTRRIRAWSPEYRQNNPVNQKK